MRAIEWHSALPFINLSKISGLQRENTHLVCTCRASLGPQEALNFGSGTCVRTGGGGGCLLQAPPSSEDVVWWEIQSIFRNSTASAVDDHVAPSFASRVWTIRTRGRDTPCKALSPPRHLQLDLSTVYSCKMHVPTREHQLFYAAPHLQ